MKVAAREQKRQNTKRCKMCPKDQKLQCKTNTTRLAKRSEWEHVAQGWDTMRGSAKNVESQSHPSMDHTPVRSSLESLSQVSDIGKHCTEGCVRM